MKVLWKILAWKRHENEELISTKVQTSITLASLFAEETKTNNYGIES